LLSSPPRRIGKGFSRSNTEKQQLAISQILLLQATENQRPKDNRLQFSAVETKESKNNKAGIYHRCRRHFCPQFSELMSFLKQAKQ
jgi:hypothetical protein